jgi:hypothetical protein
MFALENARLPGMLWTMKTLSQHPEPAQGKSFLFSPKATDASWIFPAITTGVACASGSAILGSGVAGPVGAIVGGIAGAACGFLIRRDDEKKG